MVAPEPMLSAPAVSWPSGGAWVLQPKWDGFRLLVAVDRHGRVRAWSRHGNSLTGRIGDLVDAIGETVPPGTVLDGELVALHDSPVGPVQDFAAVSRAVFSGDRPACTRLHLVAFDVLTHAGADLCQRSWHERDAQLRQLVVGSQRVFAIQSWPAAPAAHTALVAHGFEGCVLKQPRSPYRAGRHNTWRKHKARHHTNGELAGVRRGRDGHHYALVDLDDQRVMVSAAAADVERVGREVMIAYSRVDADGTLREARICGRDTSPLSTAG